jgi:hypothetical protein
MVDDKIPWNCVCPALIGPVFDDRCLAWLDGLVGMRHSCKRTQEHSSQDAGDEIFVEH